jgi:hypothetical protein
MLVTPTKNQSTQQSAGDACANLIAIPLLLMVLLLSKEPRKKKKEK